MSDYSSTSGKDNLLDHVVSHLVNVPPLKFSTSVPVATAAAANRQAIADRMARPATEQPNAQLTFSRSTPQVNPETVTKLLVEWSITATIPFNKFNHPRFKAL